VILTYHSLDESGRLFSTPPSVFRRQVRALLDSRLQPAPLDQATSVPGALCLTFDDGFRSFRKYALPVLLEWRVPATLFVVSGYCGRTKGWQSSQAASEGDHLLDWSELREIADAGVVIGAHTVNHPNLTRLSDQQARQEMRDSRDQIEDRIGRPVTSLAYPYGHADARIRRLASGEFQLACGTELALVNGGSDPFLLPRIFEFYLRSPFWLRRLRRPEGRAYVSLRRRMAAARDTLTP
jgi:peptidoglycan/xylan/chitin deacetylase (PgdA/CDA1 family)